MLNVTKELLTRRALGGAHVPPTKVFRRLTGSVNKTTLKPRVAAAAAGAVPTGARGAAPSEISAPPPLWPPTCENFLLKL